MGIAYYLNFIRYFVIRHSAQNYCNYFTSQTFFLCSLVITAWQSLQTTSRRATSSTNNLSQKPGRSEYVLRLPTGIMWFTSTFFLPCNLLHTAHWYNTLFAFPENVVCEASFRATEKGFHQREMFRKALLILDICILCVSLPELRVLATRGFGDGFLLFFIDYFIRLWDVTAEFWYGKSANIFNIFFHLTSGERSGGSYKHLLHSVRYLFRVFEKLPLH